MDAAEAAVAHHQHVVAAARLGARSAGMMLIATLALLFSCASAIVMWRKRNPKGLGAPRKAPAGPAPTGRRSRWMT